MPELSQMTSLLASLQAAQALTGPYPHWLLSDVLPAAWHDELLDLPLAPPSIDDTKGRRETHNSTRLFFGAAAQAAYPVCADLAALLRDARVTNNLQTLTGAKLRGSLLRIEYCLDTNGFWLEPHTDIGAKFFTMLIYLNDPPPGEDWGTDIYTSPSHRLGSAPSGRNKGLIFVPGANTWHGFEKRPITGVRRTLIVNYVTPDWRARHELASPEAPIG
ncbi:MAG: 2OG-Fe(II) oxygenase [Rhodospirillales bacterium]|nr:2OG-Fe(II) oxygenase [Rhodospirillales bacterium]